MIVGASFMGEGSMMRRRFFFFFLGGNKRCFQFDKSHIVVFKATQKSLDFTARFLGKLLLLPSDLQS